jgi:hypothetical protein
LWTFLVAQAFLHRMAVRHFAGAGGRRFLMEDFVRTNPTSTLTVRDYADAARPDSLNGLSAEDSARALEDAERRGMDLARRLGVDRSDRRLPVYIWAIVFGEMAA